MSKHRAPEDDAPATEVSSVLVLAEQVEPSTVTPFSGTVVPRGPRHARDTDEPDVQDAVEPEVADKSEVAKERDDDAQFHGPPAQIHADSPRRVRRLSRPARARLRKPVLVGAAAALCLLTVGGGTVTAMSKTVSIVVDGKTQKVSTMSGSVAGALAAAGITATSHDAVAPAIDSAIADGSTIVLERGRLLSVTVDGQQRQIWTTADDAQDAAAQLRSSADLAPAANRSRTIPLAGTPSARQKAAAVHTVTVSVAGRPATQSITAARTVGELLTALRTGFGPYDTVTPAAATKLRDGLTVKVNRVRVSTTTTPGTLAPPAATTVEDSTIVKGTSTVVRPARSGSELVTYTVTTVNGRQVSKVITGRKVLVEPVGQITHVGTRSGFTYDGNQVFTNDTSFGVNWDGLAMCESTHNPRAINANPSAGLPTYGMFQFDLPTWESVGGSGNPIDASPEEQLMRAKLLFQSRGLQPWACRYAAH